LEQQAVEIRTVRTLLFGIIVAAVAGAACSGQSTVPAIRGAMTNGGAAQPAHVATQRASKVVSPTVTTPGPSSTPITLGGSMGVTTWADGDTTSGGQGKLVDGIGCDKHMSSTIHLHIHLDIFDANGNHLQMPWAIGIVAPWGFKHRPAGQYVETGTCFYDLHSHDRDGVIHYESTDHTGLTLGSFFDVWGMPLSTTNVAGLTGTVWVMYGTQEPKHMTWSNAVDPRTIPLVEHEYIELAIDNPVKPNTLPVYRWTY
jgi:hypothetical protein